MRKILTWAEVTPNSLLLFQHLPKTAGTAFSTALEGVFGKDHYQWFHGPAGALQEVRNNTQLKAVGGHFHLNHKLAREIKQSLALITLFRDPVDRVLSNYYYFQRNTDHHLHGMAIQHALGEIFEKGMGHRMQMENQIVKMVSQTHGTPEEMLESAKQTVQQYSFFGFQDQMSVMEKLVRQKFNADEFQIPDLTSRSKRPKTMPGIELLELIKEHNKLDQELYDYARQLYDAKLGVEWI